MRLAWLEIINGNKFEQDQICSSTKKKDMYRAFPFCNNIDMEKFGIITIWLTQHAVT